MAESEDLNRDSRREGEIRLTFSPGPLYRRGSSSRLDEKIAIGQRDL